MSNKKKRAVALPHGVVGPHRYQVYVRIRERVDAAKRDGYMLEAVTLIESALADRLESRASYITKQDQGFSTLGKLIDVLRHVEPHESFRMLVEEIDKWRCLRNRALHELPKFEEGKLESWERRYSGLSSIVDEGQRLLCRFAALDEHDRACKPSVRPPATAPNVFAAWCPEDNSQPAQPDDASDRASRGG